MNKIANLNLNTFVSRKSDFMDNISPPNFLKKENQISRIIIEARTYIDAGKHLHLNSIQKQEAVKCLKLNYVHL